MIIYERPIRFDEVDPAGIVFFARYANFAHEAVESFFGDLEGGYPALIQKRRIGLPIVHIEADFRAPLRYGDTLRIETSCAKLGNSSATFAHEIRNARTGELCTVVRHVVVTVALDSFRACAMPDDVRKKLALHMPTAG
ncbi:MAG TPA: acyl-CoA thioesterase [Polyangiaceae bacterium]